MPSRLTPTAPPTPRPAQWNSFSSPSAHARPRTSSSSSRKNGKSFSRSKSFVPANAPKILPKSGPSLTSFIACVASSKNQASNRRFNSAKRNIVLFPPPSRKRQRSAGNTKFFRPQTNQNSKRAAGACRIFPIRHKVLASHGTLVAVASKRRARVSAQPAEEPQLEHSSSTTFSPQLVSTAPPRINFLFRFLG